MAKIYETSSDIKEIAQEKFSETNLAHVVSLRVLSTKKAKTILKVSKASAILNGVTKDDIVLVIYEEAFDRLSDEFKEKLMEGAFSNVVYDSEKDKVLVEGDFAKEVFRMRKKYPNYVDIAETSYMVIEQIEEEEKQRKEDEKLRKAEARAAKKKNN